MGPLVWVLGCYNTCRAIQMVPEKKTIISVRKGSVFVILDKKSFIIALFPKKWVCPVKGDCISFQQ